MADRLRFACLVAALSLSCAQGRTTAAKPSRFLPLDVDDPCLPARFYANIDFADSGDALKNALSVRLFDHTILDYGEIWTAFWDLMGGEAGCRSGSDPLLRGIYSNRCWDRSQQCGNYKAEGDCFNREHSWPKSWWGGMDVGLGAETDLFAIFPSDGFVNGIRSSYPFGKVTGRVDYNSSNGSQLGHCDNGSFSGRCFEPADEWKGVLARGFFYISTTYQGRWQCCNTAGTDRAVIKPWMLDQLLAWHELFPVSEIEKRYNDVVCMQYQQNRNPFIDFPHLARRIFVR